MEDRFFSKKIYAAPFGRYRAGSEVESPADEVLVGREGQRAYFIDQLLRSERRGAYLVTGHRGVGKTNFVRYCLKEYKNEVFERFLRSNVGRTTFWDRFLIFGLTAAFILFAVIVSELMELVGLAISEQGGTPRNILLWFVLSPIILLCLYPALLARGIVDAVARAISHKERTNPIFTILGLTAVAVIIWFIGPFGAPAVSMSRLLCALCAMYLWVQCTSFRSIRDGWRFGRRHDPTLLFFFLLGVYVLFFPEKWLDYPLPGREQSRLPLPLKEFIGNLGLSLILFGSGCILRGLDAPRLSPNWVSRNVERSVARSYYWAGGFLALCGLGIATYQGIVWAVAIGILAPIAAWASYWLRFGRTKSKKIETRFTPQPLLVLSFKAFLALTVSLQLVHPVISKLPKPIVADPETKTERTNDLRSPATLKTVSGLAILPAIPPGRTEAEPTLFGGSTFNNPFEELCWMLCIFLGVAVLYYLEYEWLVRPFWRQRDDEAIDPGRSMLGMTSENRRVLKDLAGVTFPWLLYRAWLPILVASVNLGFERLDHRRVVHAMLVSLRARYHRAFLAWNSPIGNLGRILGLIILLILVAIVGEHWFSMPEVEANDQLKTVIAGDYREICDLFEGRQQGAGAVNLICKLRWGDEIFHVLTYNLATSKISGIYRSGVDHVLFYLFPYLEHRWPAEEVLRTLSPSNPPPPLFEDGVHVRIYHVLLFLVLLLTGKFLLRRLPIFPYRETLKKIDEVTDQLSSTTSVTSTTGRPQPSNWLRGFLVDERVRQVQQDPVDPRTVEFVFLNLLEDIQSSAFVLPGGRNQLLSLPTPEITFVFDELDKLGSRADPFIEGFWKDGASQSEMLHAEHRRSAELHQLLADMKNLLSSAPARFIFVGGRNLHDEWLADQTARQPLLTNIFNAEVYLPSLLTDYSRREAGSMDKKVGMYIRAQVRRARALYEHFLRKESLPSFALRIESYAEQSFVPPENQSEIDNWIKVSAGRLSTALMRLKEAVAAEPLMRARDALVSWKALSDEIDSFGRPSEEIEKAGQAKGGRRSKSLRPLKEDFHKLRHHMANFPVVFERDRSWNERNLDNFGWADPSRWSDLQGKGTAGLLSNESELVVVTDNLRSLRSRALDRETKAGVLQRANQIRIRAGAIAKLAQEIEKNATTAISEAASSIENKAINLQDELYKNDHQLADAIKETEAALRDLEKALKELQKKDEADTEDEVPFGLKFFDVKQGIEIGAREKEMTRDFAQFLAYRSKGNPKRLKELLESFIRPVGRIVLRPEFRDKEFPCEHVLAFDDVSLFRVQLLARVYRNLTLSFEPRILRQDDKMAMSVLALSDFIFKFHRRAFSWSNLERVDELVHIHRAPDLRDILERLVTDWSIRFLHPIRNGMYDFRFLSEVAREIEYISRESQEEMAAFNFTLDESQTLKAMYRTMIQRLGDGTSKELQDLIAGLGELYEFDQDYETARFYYRKSISLLDKDLREMIGGGEILEKNSPALEIVAALPVGQRNARLYMTWGITRLRLMMQIGMTFELARNYERAEVEYRNAYTLARSLLMAMLDEPGRGRALALGLARELLPTTDDRLQELKHLALLFQPAFAEAWIAEKLAIGVDTSLALVEKELWELRQILPFVREKKVEPSKSPVDVKHSNFALILSELHNKAGDLYFMKGRQLVNWRDIERHNRHHAGKPRRGQEGYLLQAHYHYCMALHELRRFLTHRRLSSKAHLNIWPESEAKQPVLSPGAWPAFVYSAAGEAFNDMAESMISRVSFYGLARCLSVLSEASSGRVRETPKELQKRLVRSCQSWLEPRDESEDSPEWLNADPVRPLLLLIGKSEVPLGSVSGWLGSWKDSDTANPAHGERLLEYKETTEHDDHTRLVMAINFMMVGAKFLKRGGYLEASARELLKVCETVTYYLWWSLIAPRFIEWDLLPEGEEANVLRRLLRDKIREPGVSPGVEYWRHLTTLAVSALTEAGALFRQSREVSPLQSRQYHLGSIIPPFALTLACSLGLGARRFEEEQMSTQTNELDALLSQWLGFEKRALSSLDLRTFLEEALVRHSYPMINRLHGLAVLIQDAVLNDQMDDCPMVLLRAMELRELNAHLEAPMYFTPFSSGMAYGLAFSHWKRHRGKQSSQNSLEEDAQKILRAAQKSLKASEEMFTLRATYYDNISRLHYLYDDFNDRQLHFNHAIQMAGSEIASLLRDCLG